ncbi:MAG: DoxX family protein [Verrucomicrobiota bacterium]
MKKFLFDCGTRDATASQGVFVLRVMIGLMMIFGHGIPKIAGYAAHKDLFYVPDFFPLRYLSPQLSLLACIGAEVGASIFIILGLATRPAAFVLGFSLVVAVFGFYAAAPWFVSLPTLVESKELGLLYLIPMIALILTGAGAYSLDAGLYRESKRRRW